MSVFKLENVEYAYTPSKPIIKQCNYSFESGKVYAIVGRSGSGKTTLLSMLSGLNKPTSGAIYYGDKDISTINAYDYRSKYVGVIFQAYNLLPHLSAIENVILSMELSKKKFSHKKEYATNLLESVGLHDDLIHRKILKLSGGEQQRVAIARTLSYEPDVILADEPTGNLDHETQEAIMDIFIELAHNQNKCVIIVTHSSEVAALADVQYDMKEISVPKKVIKRVVKKVVKKT